MPANTRTTQRRARTLFALFHEYTQARWLMAFMAFSLVSGVYYHYFGPGNWNAAQLALGTHLAVGVIIVPLFIAYLRQHLPWGLKASRPGSGFRRLAWAFLLLFVVVLLSGLLNATPFFLYLVNLIWFPEFETFDFVATVHLYSALALPLLLFGHLGLHVRTRIAEPSDAAEYLEQTRLNTEEMPT
jgi:hypothetical protein